MAYNDTYERKYHGPQDQLFTLELCSRCGFDLPYRRSLAHLHLRSRDAQLKSACPQLHIVATQGALTRPLVYLVGITWPIMTPYKGDTMKDKLKNFWTLNKMMIVNASAVVGVLGVASYAAYQQKASENEAAQAARQDLILTVENHFNTN